jgi:hypothetical protein
MSLADSQWIKNIEYVRRIPNSVNVNPALIFDKYFLCGITEDNLPTYSPNKKDNFKVRHLVSRKFNYGT